MALHFVRIEVCSAQPTIVIYGRTHVVGSVAYGELPKYMCRTMYILYFFVGL